MSIKVKALNKYYIKQYIINNKSFQQFVDEEFPTIDKDSKIIGYMFCKQVDKHFNEPTQVLNLYLIRKAIYNKPAISLNALEMSWKLFLLSYESKKNTYVYVNPPFETWLDTKNNWCKKVATNLSRQFKIDFEEALSNVYFSITKLYDKGNVYMGSLNYVQQSIYNDMLMDIRYNKNRVNADSGLAISLNTPIGYDADGKEITIEETLAEAEDVSEESLQYKSTLECCKRLMANKFSPREIDQIIRFEGVTTVLPRTLYVKLCNWRKEHSPEEVLNK